MNSIALLWLAVKMMELRIICGMTASTFVFTPSFWLLADLHSVDLC